MTLIMNPFSALSDSIPAVVMQAYVIAMAVLVIGGTLLDIIHKKSAQYFFENARKAKEASVRSLSVGQKSAVTVQAVAEDVLTSAEFCNPKRRVAHLLTMYGFVFFLIATVMMVFYYPAPGAATPQVWPVMWHIGALMVCLGGFWFWFFIRADVAAEGNPWYRIVRADLFILSLLATTLFGLIWSVLQAQGAQAWASLLWLAVEQALAVPIHHRELCSVRRRAVVEVLPHVLQARGGYPEAPRQGRRLAG